MSDIKVNKKSTFGDDEFKVTTDDIDAPEEYYGLSHDTDHVNEVIGKGSKVVESVEPILLASGEYFDLPEESAGWAEILVADAGIYGKIAWDSDAAVTLIDGTTSLFTTTDTGTVFCAFDNGTSVRVKNRLNTAEKILFNYHYTENVLAPTFRIFKTLSGVDNLDPNLTINETTVTPTFRYKGGDANATDWEAWTYGETLSLVSVATPPTYNAGSPGLGASDDSVKFNESDYYKAANGTFADIATEDIVVEFVWKHSYPGASAIVLASKRDGTDAGFQITDRASNVVRFFLEDTSTNTGYVESGSDVIEHAWNHCMVFINRDEASANGASIFINGVSSGTADLSGVGTITNSAYFCVGAKDDGTLPSDSGLAFFAMWKQASWHQAGALGPSEWAIIAKERFAKLCGYHPEIFHNTEGVLTDGDMEAVGTADWTAVDSTLSKDTTAPLYEGTQHLRITSTSNTFFAAPNPLIIQVGKTYRVAGAARSVSGSAVPAIFSTGPGYAWTGTSSTDWQEFDITITPTGTTFYIGSPSSHPGVVDFDNVTVTQINSVPNTAERDYPAYIDKLEEGDIRKLYYVGDNWLRMCHRKDSNDVDVKGYLPETAAQNLVQESEDFTTWWAKFNAGDTISTGAAVCPDGRTAANSLIADDTNGTHAFYKSITVAVATYTFSIFAKPGEDPDYGNDWIRLYNSTASASCYFDVANGTVGTASGSTGYIEGPFYGGYYRCAMVFTGTAAAHAFYVYTADADLDPVTQGNGVAVSTYFWGAQLEAGGYMTSPVRTDGGVATRVKDNLRYVASDHIGGEDNSDVFMYADVLIPDYNNVTYLAWAGVSDDGSSADRIVPYISTSDTHYFVTAATAGNGGVGSVAGDCSDGAKHELAIYFDTDNVYVSRDGVDGTADTSADMPDDLNVLDVGQDQSAAYQLCGLLQNFRIYPVKG